MVLQRLLGACFAISRKGGDTHHEMSKSLPREPPGTDNAAPMLLPVDNVRPPDSNNVAKEFFKLNQQQASRCRVDPGYTYGLRSERGPLSSRAQVGGIEYNLIFVNPLAEGSHEGGVPIVYAGAALAATSMGELGTLLNNPLAAEYSDFSSCELDSPREAKPRTMPQCGVVPCSSVLDGNSNNDSPLSPGTPLQGINLENVFIPACPLSPKLATASCYVPASRQVHGSYLSAESKCGGRLGSERITSAQEQYHTNTVTGRKPSGTRAAVHVYLPENIESCSCAEVQSGPLATPNEPLILPPQTPMDNEASRRHVSVDSLPEQQRLDMAEVVDHLADGGDIAAAVLNPSAAQDVFAPCTPPLAVRDGSGSSLNETSTVGGFIVPPRSRESLKTPGEPGYKGRLTRDSCGESDGHVFDIFTLRSAASEPPLVSPPQLSSDDARVGACGYSATSPQALVAEAAPPETSKEDNRSSLAGNTSLRAETVQQGSTVTGQGPWTAEVRPTVPVAAATEGFDSVQSLLEMQSVQESGEQHQIGIQLTGELRSGSQAPLFKKTASEAEVVASLTSSQCVAQSSCSAAQGSIQRQPNNAALSRPLFSLPPCLASQDEGQQLPAPPVVSPPATVTVQMAVGEGWTCAAGPEQAVMHINSVVGSLQCAKSSPLDHGPFASVGPSNGSGLAATTSAAATSLVSLPSLFLPNVPPALIRPHLAPHPPGNSEGNSVNDATCSADCDKVGPIGAHPTQTLPATQVSEESSKRVAALHDPGCSISGLAMTRLLIRQMGLLPEAPLAACELPVPQPAEQDAAAADGELAASPFATAMNAAAGAFPSTPPRLAACVAIPSMQRSHSLGVGVDNQQCDHEAPYVTTWALAPQSCSTKVLMAKDDPLGRANDGGAAELMDDVENLAPNTFYSSCSSTRESSMLFGEESSYGHSLYGLLSRSSMQNWLEPQLWKPLREKFGGARQVAEAQTVAA